MRSLALISVICLHFCWSDGYAGSDGVGAFAYQDSSGNRYGGTYGLRDGQVFGASGYPPPYAHNSYFPSFPAFPQDDFFPEFFRNFENLLHESFKKNKEQQKIALDTAHKAFDLTSNKASYIPDFGSRFSSPFGGFPGFGNFGPDFGMPRFDGNSAFASAVAGPDFTRHQASISPESPKMRNIDVTSFAEPAGGFGQPNFKSVHSSSYSSSSNINGKQVNHRGSETMVNDNGKVTGYSVHN